MERFDKIFFTLTVPIVLGKRGGQLLSLAIPLGRLDLGA